MGPEIPEGSTVQVRFAGTWYDARVLSWSMEDESWWARVRWMPPSGNRPARDVPGQGRPPSRGTLREPIERRARQHDRRPPGVTRGTGQGGLSLLHAGLARDTRTGPLDLPLLPGTDSLCGCFRRFQMVGRRRSASPTSGTTPASSTGTSRRNGCGPTSAGGRPVATACSGCFPKATSGVTETSLGGGDPSIRSAPDGSVTSGLPGRGRTPGIRAPARPDPWFRACPCQNGPCGC